MYIMNNTGAITVPSGTPDVMSIWSEDIGYTMSGTLS
jgi:hypothetical protein